MKLDLFKPSIYEEDWYAQWLKHNAGFLPLLLTSCFKGQPGGLPENRSIRASDTQHGRFVAIEQRRYKWIYLVKPIHKVEKLPWITALIDQIDNAGGYSYLQYSSEAKQSFLVIDLPVGQYLEFCFGTELCFTLRQIEYVDLGNI